MEDSLPEVWGEGNEWSMTGRICITRMNGCQKKGWKCHRMMQPLATGIHAGSVERRSSDTG